MKALFFIFLYFLINIEICGAEIKGTVYDSWTREPLVGANIYIMGTETGTASDLNGFYIIRDLEPGKYIIKAAFVVYKPSIDTVEILNDNDIIELNFVLKSPIVDLDSISTPRLRTYHKRLEELNEEKQVLLISIDSLTFESDLLSAYLSMTNTTEESLYIFKDYPCFNRIDPVIADSIGNLIKSNRLMLDCLGEKTGPDPEDLILIKPGETIKYPAAELHFYGFSRYPKGEYSIKINYEFAERKEINTFWERNVDLLILGLRGTYPSSNSVVFINK